jgi:hypothetical protein
MRTVSTMRALIVYESMFGNTEEIAQAVAKGMQSYLATDVLEIAQAPVRLVDDVELLVVGGPTHGHGLSRPATREAAGKQTGNSPVSRGRGLREWLQSLPSPSHETAVAAFDTRFDKPRWLTGSAARGAARILRRRGYRLITEPASFYVTSTSGPLAENERGRAQEWGAAVGAAATSARPQMS